MPSTCRHRGLPGEGAGLEVIRNPHLLVLDLAGLNPRLDLVPVPLQLLDLLLEVRLELLLLVGILSVVDLPPNKKINKNREKKFWQGPGKRREGAGGVPYSRCCQRHRRPPGPSSGRGRSRPAASGWRPWLRQGWPSG
jgi:hypothetical protein